MRTRAARDDAHGRLSVLLRVRRLSHLAAPEARSLLRLLLLRHGRVSADAGTEAVLRHRRSLELGTIHVAWLLQMAGDEAAQCQPGRAYAHEGGGDLKCEQEEGDRERALRSLLELQHRARQAFANGAGVHGATDQNADGAARDNVGGVVAAEV